MQRYPHNRDKKLACRRALLAIIKYSLYIYQLFTILDRTKRKKNMIFIVNMQ